jgi:hypothetical protein
MVTVTNKSLVALLALMLLAAACHTTTLVSSWRAPDKQVDMTPLKKILVVAFFKTDASSRQAEDQMAAFLQGKGVVSYKYLGNISRSNEDSVKVRISADGFDGAVTMRLTDVEKQASYQPNIVTTFPGSYQSFISYYFRNQNAFLSSGHFFTTTVYSIETIIYSLHEERIIWTGSTRTTNPDGIKKLTAEVVHTLYKKMKTEGFITSP